MNPKIALCTIALNEMEWLPRLYEHHENWPGLVNWVFVEGADAEYAKSNPERVSEFGLSVEGTPGFLYDLAKRDNRVQYIPHGLATHRDPAQGKCVLRNRYLRALDEVKPDFIIVVDADEFYPHEMQWRINETMMAEQNAWGWCFKHRDIWYPPSLQEGKMSPNPDEYQTAHDWFNSQRAVPPCKCDHCRNERVRRFRVKESFSQEVVGGFWDIPYSRCWRWFEGLEYADNHNTPSRPKYGALDRRLARHDRDDSAPYFVHMAFASKLADRAAKHRYYETRGEAKDRKRQWYTESRAAWGTWQPRDELPNGAKVVPYTGIVPEVFR